MATADVSPLVREDMLLDGDSRAKYQKYICPSCKDLLSDPVQPSCGHWMCKSCADHHFKTASKNGRSPVCLRDECQEKLESEDGVNYFPDHFVRKDILKMVIGCVYRNRGCNWTGKLSDLKLHVDVCQYSKIQCELCGEQLEHGKEKLHLKVCPKATRQCPLAVLGCSKVDKMSKDEIQQHVTDNLVDHMEIIATSLHDLITLQRQPAAPRKDEGYHSGDFVERDGPGPKATPSLCDAELRLPLDNQPVPEKPTKLVPSLIVADERVDSEQALSAAIERKVNEKILVEMIEGLRRDMTQLVRSEVKSQSDEITSVRALTTKVERNMRSKNAELEDTNFRLSLLENCNHDGTMTWKIPQISQRMSDAQNGKYTSIFSLPFYTGRYGYKMCMRLYILGDGIGKGTHMSLFFVLMKGEFDNILQWPFTHKVTFKLLNQAGGVDVLDTFQPDPMSSSFRKPRSDMNIASGCPQFVSQHDLKNNGFIVDDTIFVKCTVDTSAIRHP